MSTQPNFLKHKKLVTVLRVLSNIGFWFSIVLMMISLGGNVALRLVSENFLNDFLMNSSGSFSIGLHTLYFEVTTEMLKSANITPVISALLIFVFFASILLATVCRQLAIVLKNVEKNNPFAIENAKCISIMGMTMAISSVILEIASSYFMRTILHTFNLQNMRINSSADTTLLLTGFLLMILGEIFRYGAYLQSEYDSTL